jgi:hypothetical protein
MNGLRFKLPKDLPAPTADGAGIDAFHPKGRRSLKSLGCSLIDEPAAIRASPARTGSLRNGSPVKKKGSKGVGAPSCPLGEGVLLALNVPTPRARG